jgi:excisionase family DNA binding protein
LWRFDYFVCCEYFECALQSGEGEMTMSATARELGRQLPSENERAVADQLRALLAAQAAGDVTLRATEKDKKPVEVTLTPLVSGLLMEMLRHISSGSAVTLVPVGEMLTTQQAADILNVSRPFLISLLEKGEINFTAIGRHRRIKARELFDYKEKRDAQRREALAALAKADAEYL